jgi:hypothetical protein
VTAGIDWASEDHAVCIVDSAGQVAGRFTMAALRPGQLDAVLAHDRAHLAGRHHAPKAAARIGRQVLPFAPLLRHSEAQVARLAELHADDTATRAADPGHWPPPWPSSPPPQPAPRGHLLRATAATLALTPVLVALTPAIAALALGQVPAA